MIFNTPNNLTIMRIAFIPVIALLMFIPQEWASWLALGFYTAACITDWLDGYLARKMKVVSAFGRFLDPIADKLLIAVLLLMFAGLNRLYDWWLLPAALIMFREIFIAGLREFLAPQNIVIHVSKLAKWKTTAQMIALGFLVVGDHGDVILPETLLIGQIFLSLAAILTVLTGLEYFAKGLKEIRKMDQ